MTACALVGALTASAYVVLVVAPACGVLVAGVAAIHVVDVAEKPTARRAVLLSGAWAALVVPVVAGIRALDAVGAMVVFSLVVLAAGAAGGWIVETCDPSYAKAEAAARDEEQLRQLLHVLPTSMLLHEWHSTGENMHSVDAQEHRVDTTRVRNLLLAELSRRDPAGVSRWLSEGDQEAPEHYLRGDSATSP